MLWVAIAGGVYILMSLVAAAANVIDKRRAEREGWRVSERTLHTLELLGGWPGALITQRMIRHKTAKLSYRTVLWGIIALHAFMWAGVLVLWIRYR